MLYAVSLVSYLRSSAYDKNLFVAPDPVNHASQLTAWKWMQSLCTQRQVTWLLFFHGATLIARSLHLHPQHL